MFFVVDYCFIQALGDDILNVHCRSVINGVLLVLSSTWCLKYSKSKGFIILRAFSSGSVCCPEVSA